MNSEFRGKTIAEIPVADVRPGDRICCWLSDASAYPVVTGYSDRVLTLSRFGLEDCTQRTFTVSGAPWWVSDEDLSMDLSRTTFILARDETEVTR